MSEAAGPDFPVLKIRASGAAPCDIQEVSLDGLVLYPRSVSVRMAWDEITVATIEVEVIPDIETAGAVLVREYVPPPSDA